MGRTQQLWAQLRSTMGWVVARVTLQEASLVPEVGWSSSHHHMIWDISFPPASSSFIDLETQSTVITATTWTRRNVAGWWSETFTTVITVEGHVLAIIFLLERGRMVWVLSIAMSPVWFHSSNLIIPTNQSTCLHDVPWSRDLTTM